MDYKDLANLIFPDAKEISYYEEKYPERNLPEGAIVTRFAPSPTGFVHIGGLYQSLIARKLASQTNGVFFLRIEDTDQKREVENAVSGIVSSLKDFAIEPDEGMISENEGKGNYGRPSIDLPNDFEEQIRKRLVDREALSEYQKELNIKRSTFYRHANLIKHAILMEEAEQNIQKG